MKLTKWNIAIFIFNGLVLTAALLILSLKAWSLLDPFLLVFAAGNVVVFWGANRELNRRYKATLEAAHDAVEVGRTSIENTDAAIELAHELASIAKDSQEIARETQLMVRQALGAVPPMRHGADGCDQVEYRRIEIKLATFETNHLATEIEAIKDRLALIEGNGKTSAKSNQKRGSAGRPGDKFYNDAFGRLNKGDDTPDHVYNLFLEESGFPNNASTKEAYLQAIKRRRNRTK